MEPDELAQATIVATTIAARAARVKGKPLFRLCTLCHHIHAARDAKLEFFIGQPSIFLQVTEGEGGSATLFVDCGQELDLAEHRRKLEIAGRAGPLWRWQRGPQRRSGLTRGGVKG